MATYHVATTGSDANGGTNATTDAWLTITHALDNMPTGTQTLQVHAGTYDQEGEVAHVLNVVGMDWTIETVDGAVTIRPGLTPVYTGAWYFSGATGSIKFAGGEYGFTFNCSLNYLIRFNTNQAIDATFDDCDMYSDADGSVGVMYGGSFQSLTLNRTSVREMKLGKTWLMNAGDLTAEACLFQNMGTVIVLYANATNVSLKNCTFRGCGTLKPSTTQTVTNFTLKNCVFESDAEYADVVGMTGAVTNFTVEGNVLTRTDMTRAEPRQTTYYDTFSINNADYYFDDMWLQPGFASTDSSLSPTSLILGRGVDAGVTTGINGEAFDNTNLPTPGCWAPPSTWKKQTISILPKVFACVGDSMTYGFRTTGATATYPRQLEAGSLSDWTLLRMPGDTDRAYGISGFTWEQIGCMALDFAQRERPNVMVLFGGVNDTLSGAVLGALQINTLDRLFDLGVGVVYAGTQPDSVAEGAVDDTVAKAAEDVVAAHCITEGYQYLKFAYDVQEIEGWNADDGSGLFDADNLHINDAGHDQMETWLETLVPAAERDVLAGGLTMIMSTLY